MGRLHRLVAFSHRLGHGGTAGFDRINGLDRSGDVGQPRVAGGTGDEQGHRISAGDGQAALGAGHGASAGHGAQARGETHATLLADATGQFQAFRIITGDGTVGILLAIEQGGEGDGRRLGGGETHHDEAVHGRGKGLASEGHPLVDIRGGSQSLAEV